MTSRPPADAPNRRAAPRKPLRETAIVVYGEVTRQVHTWDLSRDGLSLLATRPISPGTRCKVTFDVPLDDGTTTVTAAIRVVYSSYLAADEFKIGTLFTGLDEEVAVLLRRYAEAP